MQRAHTPPKRCGLQQKSRKLDQLHRQICYEPWRINRRSLPRTREQMIRRLQALYGPLQNAVDDFFIGAVAGIGYEALSDRGLELLPAWKTEPEQE